MGVYNLKGTITKGTVRASAIKTIVKIRQEAITKVILCGDTAAVLNGWIQVDENPVLPDQEETDSEIVLPTSPLTIDLDEPYLVSHEKSDLKFFCYNTDGTNDHKAWAIVITRQLTEEERRKIEAEEKA